MTTAMHERLLLSAAEAAKVCGVSERYWWSLHSSGRCPRPIRLGGAYAGDLTNCGAGCRLARRRAVNGRP